MSNDKPIQRRVFFSFDYDDVRRVEQIRNCQSLQHEKKGFIDKADREELKRCGKDAIARWIDGQLQGTSVTIVAFGACTYKSEWVGYEIKQSVNKGNGLLGIDICSIKDPLRVRLHGFDIADRGNINPLFAYPVKEERIPPSFPESIPPISPGSFLLRTSAMSRTLSNIYRSYDWVNDSGRDNIVQWIEDAAEIASRHDLSA